MVPSSKNSQMQPVMDRLLQFLSVTILMLVGLGACAPGDNTAAPANLPLADDKPTFLFFYTDT